MRPYCRAGGCSRHIIMRETAGLSTYGLVQRNNSTAGINCVRPQPLRHGKPLHLSRRARL